MNAGDSDLNELSEDLFVHMVVEVINLENRKLYQRLKVII